MIKFRSSFPLQFFSSLISVGGDVLQLVYLQPVQDAHDLIYTVHEPDAEFINQAIFYLLYSVKCG